MLSDQQIKLLEEEPSLLLALSLSAPAKNYVSIPSTGQFKVEYTTDEILVRGPIPHPKKVQKTRLLCTKETIALAVALHELWLLAELQKLNDIYSQNTNVINEQRLIDALIEHAENLASKAVEPQNYFINKVSNDNTSSSSLSNQHFLTNLGVQETNCKTINDKCIEIFRKLEQRGWAIDPSFIPYPEIMVLLGLIPMQWSVRTPEGDRVYREIRISAPLWDLQIDRIRKGKKKETNWQLNIRGINWVRKAIVLFAQHIVDSEANNRKEKGLPTLKTPQQIELDDSETE